VGNVAYYTASFNGTELFSNLSLYPVGFECHIAGRASAPGSNKQSCQIFFYYYVLLWPTKTQLFHEFSHSYMFRHYRVILREFVINTLASYASISNAAVGNTIYN